MEPQFTIRPWVDKDNEKIMQIINSYVDNSFAAYSDEAYPVSFAAGKGKEARVFLIIEVSREVIGFGLISPYRPFKNFNHTGVLTYFILTEYTGLGLGTKLLNELISAGQKIGITNYLAHISSQNTQSLNFHKKKGFEEVGRFKKVAVKFNKFIDVVWVQKQLASELDIT